MKSCPVCHSAYDDAQNFCLNDGSTLVSASPDSSASSLPTENLPYNRSSAPTDVMYAAPTSGAPFAPPTSPPNAPYMTPPVQKRSSSSSPLPWILGGGAILLIAAALIIFLATRRPKDTTTTTSSGSDATSTGTTSTSSGLTYDSPDGRFSVTLPPGFSQFKSQTISQPSPAGNIELNIMQTENTSGGCMLAYSDFPEASFQGRTPLKMLEDGRDGALRNIGGTLEKQENLTVQGKTGIAVYGSGSSSGKTFYVRFNFILDKPRAYQVGYLAYDRADLDKPDVQAYFDSFHLNDKDTSSNTTTDPMNSSAVGTTAEPPPPPTPMPTPMTSMSHAPISGGVLNGKATSLPKPSYPAIAKAAKAYGTVTVQVTVDESGKVISARAVSGHPLLQQAAVQAAYQAEFSPTMLSGQPVQVTGVLTYNFAAE
jgi:TonB family protein